MQGEGGVGARGVQRIVQISQRETLVLAVEGLGRGEGCGGEETGERELPGGAISRERVDTNTDHNNNTAATATVDKKKGSEAKWWC